jgi:hypothetical protein
MKDFCDSTAMDYKVIVAKGLAHMQKVTFETLYDLVPKCSDLIQLLFEFKFLESTLKTEEADEEILLQVKRCHQALLSKIANREFTIKSNILTESECLDSEL